MGTGNFPVSRGHGPKDTTGSMELSMTDVEAMRDAAPNRSILDLPSSDFQVVFGNISAGVKKHILRNLEFTTDPGGGASGDMDLKVTLDFVASHVDHK